MAPELKTDQLIVIVGPTASGKSQAAMQVALRNNGEIICADSRTVYTGLDIGTAKPSSKDREQVPHHLLDVVRPDETFSAAKFQRLANSAIENIRARGKLPIMVGGTGLFVDGVLFNYQFGAPADPKLRTELEQKSVNELREHCSNNNIELPNNEHNKRHLIRSIEQNGVNINRYKKRQDAFVVGIAPTKEILQARVRQRAETMFGENVAIEATENAKLYGWDAPGLSGSIYPIIHRLSSGDISQQEATRLFAKSDWQLARRQMTWFKRNKSIHWHDSPKGAEQIITEHLANTN